MTTPVEADAGPEPRPEHADDPVRLLRRRWKPIKERLAQGGEHPSNVRFHRACSWLKRSLEAWHEFDDDVALVFGWTCLNALYGRWDPVAHQPENDRDGYGRFFERLLGLDTHHRIVDVLQDEKPLVMSIIEDAYLNKHFWHDPDAERGRRPDRWAYKTRTDYVDGAWQRILSPLLDRIYLLRCQLVHGAATSDSRLNRDGVRRCAQMLHHLSIAALDVYIDSGASTDWGKLCYPPTQ